MVLNSSKTEDAYLISKNGAYQYAYNKIDNALIEIVLELIFGHKMALEVHTHNWQKKANCQTQAIRHTYPHLTKAELFNVTYGLFYGKLYYCNSVWLTNMLSGYLIKIINATEDT